MEAKLLPAVEDLLRERSIHEIGLDELLSRAGVAKSTFYYHFRHKVDLLIRLAGRVADDVLTGNGWWAAFPTSRSELGARIAVTFEAYRRHALLISALLDASPSDAELRATVEGTFETASREVAAHIASGQKRGKVRTDVRADAAATWIMSMMVWGLPRMVDPGAESDDVAVAAESLAVIIWQALYSGVTKPAGKKSAS
ncbi:hypothetical protein BST14_24925 [Mycobacterium arosiense ATCC BAA-1401 = DSM 45069]|uniref:HTH tetR-type domain-containing protein n=1 Tax=Mycobacterium arosiense ATCC BAA-1401 = DSM 45069 TaxID=1265311 RepID=A0A1W9Z794_MYCAI|nr:hypothetical protein BST14_24925 [Mycobacterium arosiense ATCC BAA-1401 = DSM 45069]